MIGNGGNPLSIIENNQCFAAFKFAHQCVESRCFATQMEENKAGCGEWCTVRISTYFLS